MRGSIAPVLPNAQPRSSLLPRLFLIASLSTSTNHCFPSTISSARCTFTHIGFFDHPLCLALRATCCCSLGWARVSLSRFSFYPVERGYPPCSRHGPVPSPFPLPSSVFFELPREVSHPFPRVKRGCGGQRTRLVASSTHFSVSSFVFPVVRSACSVSPSSPRPRP